MVGALSFDLNLRLIMTRKEKKILILAGPNGAGKTTFAREFLPAEASCLIFINADLIAAGLSPFSPGDAAIQAGKLMLREIEQHAKRGESFAFETTLSGRIFARMIPGWRESGYRVKLFFLSLPDVETAISRVAVRVGHGGHDIPEKVIRRRYTAGWENFNNVYKSIVDKWVLYDNSGASPTPLEKGENR